MSVREGLGTSTAQDGIPASAKPCLASAKQNRLGWNTLKIFDEEQNSYFGNASGTRHIIGGRQYGYYDSSANSTQSQHQ